jgi:hypothetical protein
MYRTTSDRTARFARVCVNISNTICMSLVQCDHVGHFGSTYAGCFMIIACNNLLYAGHRIHPSVENVMRTGRAVPLSRHICGHSAHEIRSWNRIECRIHERPTHGIAHNSFVSPLSHPSTLKKYESIMFDQTIGWNSCTKSNEMK